MGFGLKGLVCVNAGYRFDRNFAKKKLLKLTHIAGF
jgi:hypothetical protein